MTDTRVAADTPGSGKLLTTAQVAAAATAIACLLFLVLVHLLLAGGVLAERFDGREVVADTVTPGSQTMDIVWRVFLTTLALAGALSVRGLAPRFGILAVLRPRPHGFAGFATAGLIFSAYGLSAAFLPDTTVIEREITQRTALQSILTSLAAGPTEEIAAAALIGVALVGASVRWIPRPLQVGLVMAGVGLAAAARGAQHLYQSDRNAFLQVVLGLALAGLFLWCRSVWPALVAHCSYDLAVTLPDRDTALWILAAAAVVFAVYLGVRVWRGSTPTRRQPARH